MTDDALILTVTRAQQGDARAFDALVRRYQNTAVAYARTLLRDPVAAEDAAQEAFVQAWRDLPSLTEAAAFGAWLRRIVFKFCDRASRSARPTLLLDDSLPLPEDLGPASVIERADEAARVRAAIDALPCSLREVTLLYYLTGHDTREIAAFLEVPLSTVKNRLHASRKRLRKELWTMADTLLEEEKPSQNETFAENVLARVLHDFQSQEAADPHTANRELLDQGRTALFQMLANGAPLDIPTARNGFIVLWRKQDWRGLSTYLMRYLGQPLSDSETAWSYVHLANALAMGGSPAGAVLAHETFERWFPGKSPYLSADWPYYPVGKDTEGPLHAKDDVRLLFLSQSAEFATSYLACWRNAEYLAKVDAALADIAVTPRNYRGRRYVLRMACTASERAGDFDRAQRYVRQMHILAEGASNEALKAEIEAEALGHQNNIARLKGDDKAFTAGAAEMTALLSAAETNELGSQGWKRGLRHNLAFQLVLGNRHELALPLWEENAANGGHTGSGAGWFMHAATLWRVTHDRERTLALLREARAREDTNLTTYFAERREFAEVREDPEFLQAISWNQS